MLEKFIEALDKVALYLPSFLIYVLLVLGTVKLLVAISSAKRCLAQNFFTREHDLYKRYQGGWAVVTGASDGIGAEYARQLAKRGFNVCLISRTLSKLENIER